MRGGVCGERGFLGYLVFGGLLGFRQGLGLRLLRSFSWGIICFFGCWFLSMLVDRVGWVVVVWGFGIE